MFKILFLFGNILSGLNNTEYIQIHNNKNLSYNLSENQFVNRVYNDEFYMDMKEYKIPEINNLYDDSDIIYEKSVDWRKKNKVSSVKNQGQCGGCWAFSSIGAVESAWAIKHNILYNLSEQQLIDCSNKNHGCEGGSMDLAFEYMKNNSICNNISYSYTASDNMCQKDCNGLFEIKDYVDINRNNIKSLMKAVSKTPVSVAIQANKRSFQLYQSGIYSDPDCGYNLDHGVLLVGYGYDKLYDLDYWIIKNSWGKSWGENGYIRLLKDDSDSRGQCGIAMMPSIPIV